MISLRLHQNIVPEAVPWWSRTHLVCRGTAHWLSRMLLCQMVAVSAVFGISLTSAPTSAEGAPQVASAPLPLVFEANQGQTDSQVKFLARIPGATLFLTEREAVLALRQPSGNLAVEPSEGHGTSIPSPSTAVLRFQFVSANPSPRVEGMVLPGASHYFLGNDPRRWRTHIPTYAKVAYRDVYPGIDLVYYGHSRQLEYDFVVAQGLIPR